jgi:UDP-N-acetylmuramoylalanine--D-glutamate ligase
MSASQLDTLTSWHADWKGLRVAVLGLSVTGFSAADTLAELGADVVVYSESADPEYERLLPVLGVRSWVGPLSDVPSDLEASRRRIL